MGYSLPKPLPNYLRQFAGTSTKTIVGKIFPGRDGKTWRDGISVESLTLHGATKWYVSCVLKESDELGNDLWLYFHSDGKWRRSMQRFPKDNKLLGYYPTEQEARGALKKVLSCRNY